MIWDRLFGTFVEERDDLPCEYGITRQIQSHDPIKLTFHEWQDMFKDVFTAKEGFREGIKHLWMPPEWQAQASGLTSNRVISPRVPSRMVGPHVPVPADTYK